MVAWMSYLMGDLVTADRHSAEMAARLLPGQAPYPALHLFAWRAVTLNTLGRWDEAVGMFWRALEAWNEAGRHAAGYGLRGFAAGLDIGRARGDARLIGAATEAMESILGRFPTRHFSHAWITYIQGEVSFAGDDVFLRKTSPAEMVERRLNLVCDRRAAMSRTALEAGLDKAQRLRIPVLEAQFRRALALSNHDPSEMSVAIEIWERLRSVPQLGRAHAERGLLLRDQAETDAGLSILKKLGDVNYVDHFAALV
jgi:tetratricopeptide (TPR) repeat protein